MAISSGLHLVSFNRHRRRPRMWGAVIRLAATILLVTRTALADSTLSIKVAGDDIAMPHRARQPGQCEPCAPPTRPGDTIIEYVAHGRARRDRGAMSIVLDTDANKIDFICHATRLYSEVAYPVQYDRLLKSDYQRSVGALADYQVASPATETPAQVKQWKTVVFETTVVNGLRSQYGVRIAVADAVADADSPLLVLQKIAHEILQHGHGWSRFIPFTDGLPIVWEERERQPETEFVYREEVLKIEQGELGASIFQVPGGYTKVKFDAECMPAR